VSALRRSILYGVLLVLLSSLYVNRLTQTKPNWSFDGYTYAIMMQMDTGVPYAQARRVSQRFYADKPPATDSETAPYLKTAYPQYWQLFAPRLLYPRIASWLWPRYGMQALLLVSEASLVGCVLLLFLLLLEYTGPEAAALLAVGFALVPEVQLLASGALTDMLATFFWFGTLWSMLRYATTARVPWLLGYAAFATLMSLTRPIAYIPLACAAVLLLAGLLRHHARFVGAAIKLGAIAFALCVLLVVLEARSGSPSMIGIMQGLRAGSHYLNHGPFVMWYAARVVAVLVTFAAAALALLAPAVAVPALWRRRMDADGVLCAGAILSSLLTALVDPIVGDATRVILVPLLPILCIGLAMAVGKGSVHATA